MRLLEKQVLVVLHCEVVFYSVAELVECADECSVPAWAHCQVLSECAKVVGEYCVERQTGDVGEQPAMVLDN